MKSKRFFIILLLVLVGCTPQNALQPEPDLSPQSTQEAQPTLIPTVEITPTEDLYTLYLSKLPELPQGFTWKLMIDKSLAMGMPDGWYFREENRIENGLYGAYVTRENIDELNYFLAGIAVMIYDFDTSEEANTYAQALIYAQGIQETTMEVYDQSSLEREDGTMYTIKIRAEYPYEVEGNQDKTIQYAANATGNHVVFIIMEAPTNEWEEFFSEYGILGSYVAYFAD